MVWQLDLQLPMQSVPITIVVMNSDPAHGEVHLIQHNVIKFVSDLQQLLYWYFQQNQCLNIKKICRTLHTQISMGPLGNYPEYPCVKTALTTLCDNVCQWLTTGPWFSLGNPVSSANKTDRRDSTEILLKVTLNTITLNPFNGFYK